jgi:eukaryotic-like serine/threonine-protein kinase
MELVEGASITEYCNSRRLSVRERLELFLPVCQAVQHAHHKGIIHRDIKPSNIIVTEYDGRPVPKVIDFGLAKAAEQSFSATAALTQFGSVVGTLQYMSPEQAQFEGRDLDTRTDIYSLGAVLYELLTGTTPLDTGHLANAAYGELLRRIAEEDPRPPSVRVGSSPEILTRASTQTRTDSGRLPKLLAEDLDWVVMRALEKDRTRRYPTANALFRDIQRYLAGDVVEAGRPSNVYRLRKFAKRHRALLAVSCAFAVLLAVAATVSIVFAVRAERERKRAVAAMHQVQAEQLVGYASESLRADPERSILLAMHAVNATRRFDEPASLAAEGMLHKAILSSQLRGTLRGHTDEVRGVAFSPDGKRLATGADDGTVRIWDAETQKELLSIRTGSAWIWAVEFSPDGRRVAAGNSDSTITLLDSTTGKVEQTLRGHTGGVTSLVFTGDGTRMVTGSQDRTVRVWDLSDGKDALVLREHRSGVWSVALSPDGKWIASGGDDGVLRIHDAASGRELKRLRGHRDTIRSVAFSPDGARLISAAQDQTVRIWDAASGEEKRAITDDGGRFRSAAFIYGGGAFITGGTRIRIWDTASGGAMFEFPGHRDIVLKVALSPDGQRFATASADRTAKIWDASGGAGAAPVDVGVSAEAREVLRKGNGMPRWILAANGSKTALFREDGDSIEIIDAKSGRHVSSLHGARSGTRRVEFSPDGGLFAASGSDGKILVWNTSDGALLREWEASGKVSEVALGRRWLAAGVNNEVRIWDARTGAQHLTLRVQNSAVRTVAISPDESTIAAGYEDGVVVTWKLATGEMLQTLRGHGKEVHSVVFTSDGARLASGSGDPEVRIWDARTGVQLALIPRVLANLAFDPSGTRLAVSSFLGLGGLAVFDGSTGKLLFTLQPESRLGRSPFAFRVGFSGDGKSVLTTGDGTVRRYPLDVHELLGIARQRVTRELTADECSRYFGSPECPVLPD